MMELTKEFCFNGGMARHSGFFHRTARRDGYQQLPFIRDYFTESRQAAIASRRIEYSDPRPLSLSSPSPKGFRGVRALTMSECRFVVLASSESSDACIPFGR